MRAQRGIQLAPRAHRCSMAEPLNRRVVLAQLAALGATALNHRAWALDDTDPLSGTIAHYQAGLSRGAYTAEQMTARALDRCRTSAAAWRAIDALSDTAIADARASDQRRRAPRTLGPLDGVPLFAKAIYAMTGFPTPRPHPPCARPFP